jgi:hypothetical protein
MEVITVEASAATRSVGGQLPTAAATPAILHEEPPELLRLISQSDCSRDATRLEWRHRRG